MCGYLHSIIMHGTQTAHDTPATWCICTPMLEAEPGHHGPTNCKDRLLHRMIHTGAPANLASEEQGIAVNPGGADRLSALIPSCYANQLQLVLLPCVDST